MSDRPEAVMIFAAGFGTRMGALTRDRPKPLIEVAGRPLIDHAIAIARRADPRQIVVNAHYRATLLAEHLAGRGVLVSHETPDILDTGGGLRQALPLLGDGPVFTLNCDAVWTDDAPLARLAEAWEPTRMDGLLLLIAAEKAVGRSGAASDFNLAADGRIARGQAWVYTGAQIIRTEGLRNMRETTFSLNLLWDRMITEGRLFGLACQGGWADVGTPGGIAQAEAMLAGAPHV